MNLNKMRDEIHQNAIAHGWWDEERSFGEIIALCHSELSEALEEYRKGQGKDIIYYKCQESLDYFTKYCPEPTMYACGNSCGKGKPEGIPTELADCIIRILDYCGREEVDIEKHQQFIMAIETKNFGDFISLAHLYLSKAYENNSISPLKGLICEIQSYCKSENINIEEAIAVKHEYNKTRTYKHGGKVI